MSYEEAREIIATTRAEIEQAADILLSAAEKGLRELNDARGGTVAAFDELERSLCTILETCAFQDLTGQRLSTLEGMLLQVPVRPGDSDPLLNGPALPGAGLDQAAADELLRRTDCSVPLASIQR